MPTKNLEKNRQYVAKSRAKLINTIGIEEYRRRNAEAQRAYRARRKAIKKQIMSNISKDLDVNDPTSYRQKLRSSKNKK
jgi:hypothetical protein